MAKYLEILKEHFARPFEHLTSAQKVTMIMVFLLTVVGTGAVLKWALKPEYHMLASDLDASDAQAIVEELGANNVPYKFVQGGRGIMTPKDVVYEWRMKLASKSLPSSSGLGYEIFDKKDIGISEFVQKINYRRALEGELVRTIQSMPEVNRARIHIVFPKDRLFKEDQEDPTASIFLSFKGNTNLSESQVKGIALLVSGSVEGLEPDNVTILDEHGNILSKRLKNNSLASLNESQLELQFQVESYLENKAQSMLDRVLGVNNSIVRATAELDFRRIEKTNERFDPEAQVVLSEEIENSTLQDSLSGDNVVEHSITNYQTGKNIEHVIEDVGNIKRLTMAVLVSDRIVENVSEEGEINTEYIPRTPAELASISSMTRNAIGLNEARGDQLEVQSFPFENNRLSPPEPDYPNADLIEKYFPYAKNVLIAIAIIIGFFIVRSKMKKARKSLMKLTGLNGSQNRQLGQEPKESLEKVKSIENLQAEVEEATGEQLRKREGLINFIEGNPSMSASLIRAWLMED